MSLEVQEQYYAINRTYVRTYVHTYKDMIHDGQTDGCTLQNIRNMLPFAVVLTLLKSIVVLMLTSVLSSGEVFIYGVGKKCEDR